jgi:DNA-binding MltR family transcriptional regulator
MSEPTTPIATSREVEVSPSDRPKEKHSYNLPSYWSHVLEQEFDRETDRGAAILAASLLDSALGSLLYNFLVPNPGKDDDLFDGPTAPLANFSARISVCYRLGLISQRMSRDLHLVRKIRNEFAHNIQGATFSSTAIKTRILELAKSHGISERGPVWRRKHFPAGDRGEFLVSVSWMLWTLHNKVENLRGVRECDLEWGYNATFDE